MDNAEHEDDPIFLDDVVHHAIVANAESVKRVRKALDCLDCFTPDTARSRGFGGKLFECVADPRSHIGSQLLDRFRCAGRELDPIGTQPRSFRLAVRPLA